MTTTSTTTSLDHDDAEAIDMLARQAAFETLRDIIMNAEPGVEGMLSLADTMSEMAQYLVSAAHTEHFGELVNDRAAIEIGRKLRRRGVNYLHWALFRSFPAKG